MSDGDVDEHCRGCNTETPHKVAIELRRDADADRDPGGFSREPYRVTECLFCGLEDAVRMNKQPRKR